MLKKNPKNSYSPSDPPTFLKYIGLSFQLCAIIGLGTWFGWYLDQRSGMKFPLWILVFCLLSVVVSLYNLYMQLKNDDKSEGNRKKS
jgi:F0F1-type ATP synthase assembly protein I